MFWADEGFINTCLSNTYLNVLRIECELDTNWIRIGRFLKILIPIKIQQDFFSELQSQLVSFNYANQLTELGQLFISC